MTVGLVHPNVYRLLDSLRREQTLTELTLRQARQGASPPRRRPKYRLLDRRLERLRDAYRQTKGPATRNDFVNDIVNDACADTIFATLKAVVDDDTTKLRVTFTIDSTTDRR